MPVAPKDANLPAMIFETDDSKAIRAAQMFASLCTEVGHQTVWHVPATLPEARYIRSNYQMQLNDRETERRPGR